MSSLPTLEPHARPVDRAWRPHYAVWELTLGCDLACSHCSSRAGRPRAEELSLDEARKLVADLAALGVEEITLIGGEAYLRDDWLEVIRAIRAHRMRCGLVTGGRAFTPERAQAARAAGLQSVSVSVDGLEASHDQLRGVRGSYLAAFAAIANARAAGMQATANTQIGKSNLRDIPEVFERLL